jgi:hypothetical protein
MDKKLDKPYRDISPTSKIQKIFIVTLHDMSKMSDEMLITLIEEASTEMIKRIVIRRREGTKMVNR